MPTASALRSWERSGTLPKPKVIRLTRGNVVPARIVSEDDEFMLLEVGKRPDSSWTTYDNMRFVTIVFTAGKPWEYEDG